MQHLDLTRDDSILCITSAGFVFALTRNGPELIRLAQRQRSSLRHRSSAAKDSRRRHEPLPRCVPSFAWTDATLTSLQQVTFSSSSSPLFTLSPTKTSGLCVFPFSNPRFSLTKPLSQLFGEGKHPDFRNLLDTKLRYAHLAFSSTTS